MDFDIRMPIGLLFSAIGALLVVLGLTADPSVYAAHSLGINVNLIWGAVMLAFGLAMLAVVVVARRRRG